MPWSPDKIPVWLRRTPEQQAADARMQEKLRQASGPGRRPSATERHLMYARATERSARAHLNHFQDRPDTDPKHIRHAAAQLAEARAMQGYYEQAAAIHPDKRHAERFAKIAEAIERPDDEMCDCQPEEKTVKGKTITLPTENIEEMVFDRRFHKLMPLHRCVKCGALNVKVASQVHQNRLSRTHQASMEARNR